MDDATLARWFGFSQAFDDPVTVWITAALVAVLILVPILLFALRRAGISGDAQHRELLARYRGWLLLVPLLAGPILLGAAWTMAVASTP